MSIFKFVHQLVKGMAIPGTFWVNDSFARAREFAKQSSKQAKDYGCEWAVSYYGEECIIPSNHYENCDCGYFKHSCNCGNCGDCLESQPTSCKCAWFNGPANSL
jgi:hypothetical protein